MTRGVRRALVALTVAFVAGGFAFALGTPVFQSPDEPPHVDLVRHHASDPLAVADASLRVRNGVNQAVGEVGLPQGGPLVWDGRSLQRRPYPRFDAYPDARADATGCRFGPFETCQNYHFVHPPTFYVLVAPVARLAERFAFTTEVGVLRVTCVLLVAPLVVLTWYAATQVWPGSRRRPVVAAALVAGFAPLTALAGGVNNDSLLLLSAGAMVAAAARLLRRPSPGAALAVGVAVGAGLAVKIEFVALALVGGVAVAVAAMSRPRREWVAYAWRAALPVAVGSAWFVRNLVRDGALEPAGGEILRPDRPGPHTGVGLVRYAFDHVGDVVGRFWGLYGQSNVETPAGWRTALAAASVLLGIGWLACRRWRRPDPAGARLGVLALAPLVLLAGSIHASWAVYRGSGEVRGLLGRYLYSALPVLAIGAVAALGAVAVRARVPARVAAPLAVAVAGGLWVAGFARAVHGLYGTRDTSLVLDRAATVAPAADPGLVWAVLGAVWLAAVVVAALAAREP